MSNGRWENLLSTENFQKFQHSHIVVARDDEVKNMSIILSDLETFNNDCEAALAVLVRLDRLDVGAVTEEDGLRLVKLIAGKILSISPNQDNRLVAEAGLACLDLTIVKSQNVCIDDTTLILIAAYTDPKDSWTTLKSSQTANNILLAQLSSDRLTNFITNSILQSFLKPLFAKSSTRVTASGRPSHFQDPAPQPFHASQLPTWREQCHWAAAVFRWAVKASTSPLIQSHWPLFTPVLLSLAEDQNPHVRGAGLEILAIFVQKCPHYVMQTTGIGAIFQDVAFPTLLFLPNLTLEKESVELLKAAYKVLIQLAQTYGDPTSSSRRQLLDKILRDGVYAGFHHASEYVHVVEVLMQCTTTIVNCLGVYTVKHLQNLLSIISSVMTDPFATAYLPSILAAADALAAIIANCWPRLSELSHVERIVSIISLCWINVHNDDAATQLSTADKELLLRRLTRISDMLQALWEQCGIKPPTKLNEVVQAEPRLSALFPTVGT